MKFTATLEITVDDEALATLVKKAGVPLIDTDVHMAALMMAMTHTYRSGRTFLMAPDHTPMRFGDTYLMTEPEDPAFHIMLTLNKGLLPCPSPKPSAPKSSRNRSTSTSPSPSMSRSAKTSAASSARTSPAPSARPAPSTKPTGSRRRK